MFCGWVKASARCLQICVLCCPADGSLFPHCLPGPPLNCFPRCGVQVGYTVSTSVHQWSCVPLTCPAQFHFHLLTHPVTSITLVFSLTKTLVFLSLHSMFNILLFIFVFVAAILFFMWLVGAHVSMARVDT